LAVAAALGVTTGLIATATPAQATPPGTKIIVATGSDTTEEFMEAYLANPDPDGPGDNGLYNLNALYDPGVTEYVPEDTAGSGTLCPERTYYSGTAPVGPPNPTLAPNGSSGGRDALRTTLTTPGATGCYDIARSSSGPRAIGSDNATFQYNAFGLDVVSVASPSLNAPASLTRQQVRDIYSCVADDWSEVGGAPGPIQRYLPQSASGTRAFFISEFLSGIDLTTTSPTCPAIIQDLSIQENVGTVIQTASYQSAILPYSAGQWIFQANSQINPTLDVRNGVRILNLQPVSTFTADTTSGSNQLVTATNNRFTAVNLGATVTGAGIPAGTTLTAVSANGQSATMSANASATAAGVTVLRTSLPGAAARWITIDPGGWLPATPNALNLRAPVAESQVTLNNSTRDYFGVRYLFNVLDSTSPQYTDANNLVGFVNVASGAKSPLCNNAASSLILNAGFAPLSSTTPSAVDPSRNLANSTCRRYIPT
jgi:ABC-type phosphate transport system substrate-binding protein